MSDLDNAILAELKKMNEFLGKMDWKLWNIHEKYLTQQQEEKVVVVKEVVRNETNTAPAATVQATTVQAAAEVPKFVPKVPAAVTAPASNLEEPPAVIIPEIPKYPSIEKA